MYREGVFRNDHVPSGKMAQFQVDVIDPVEEPGLGFQYLDPAAGVLDGDPTRRNSGTTTRTKERHDHPHSFLAEENLQQTSLVRHSPKQPGVAFRDRIDELDSAEAQDPELTRQLQLEAIEAQQRHSTHPNPELSLVTSRPPAPITESRHHHHHHHHSPKYSDSEDDESDTSSRDSPHSHEHPHRSSHSSHRRESVASSPLQKGYREARHLAGGVIHHPSQSTKHYSILRHSHGLVFYQGTSTNIAISVFADQKLPADRTYWLRPKSMSGDSKNRATFRQQTNEMIDVTPATAVNVEQLNPSDERAWQRDIKQFEKRTSRGRRSSHRLRETVISRIPADAGDGYFQIALCSANREEVLCVSSTFRLLSLSPSMGGITGAHWATLPFEIGAMALTIKAKTMIGGKTLIPLKLAAKSKANPHMPSHSATAKKAGLMAFGATGAADKVGEQLMQFNKQYNEEREAPFTPAVKIDDDFDNGPTHPFPISFTARCEKLRGVLAQRHIIPMTRLVNVPEHATHKLWGYYFGWCAISSRVSERTGRRHRPRWFQAVIIVCPIDIDDLDRITMSRANEKHVKIQILGDDDEILPVDSDLHVEVLGCIRPWDTELEKLLSDDMKAGEEVAFETSAINEMSDITLTRRILDHDAWGPEAVAQKFEEIETKPKVHGMARVKQEYTEKRLAVQKKIDQVPLHKLGVRMPVDSLKDKATVLNGYFIER